jgi:methyltransferase family protein
LPYYHEVQGLSSFKQFAGSGIGAGYGPLESQVLHCFMRAKCPPTVIEIGSGVSTACMLHAIQLNLQEGRPGTRMICIEPYPKTGFARLEGITHVREVGQAIPIQLFRDLREGDMLFVDSSHAVKTGSDTVRIYLEVIPNLPPGVFIHIHDVTLPYLYHPDILANYMGWQETVLLLALLIHNPRLSVLACQSALHHDRKQALAEVLLDYRPLPQVEGVGASPRSVEQNHFPSSTWLRTC